MTNVLQEDGVRLVQVMGNQPMGDDWLRLAPPAATPEVKRWRDPAGAYQLEMRWPVREAVDVYFEGLPRKFRRFVAWTIEGRISLTVRAATQQYLMLFGRWPNFAFVQALPRGVENGVEVDGVIVLEAEWAPPRCVFVGG